MAAEPKPDIMIKQIHDALPSDIIDRAEIISVIGSQIKLEKFSWLVKLVLKYFRKINSSYKDIDAEKIKEFVGKFQE